MKNISFMLTQEQILNKTKTVTRRMGWPSLKVGDRIQPVRKAIGLKKGEKSEKLCCPIIITKVSREPLKDVVLYFAMAQPNRDCVLEGFHEMSPRQFVDMLCKSHKGCTPDTVVTRIKF